MFWRSGNMADSQTGVGSTSSRLEFVSHSSEETIAKGREIAAKLQPPVLVLLTGDLGSGKTTLTKGIISGLGAAKEEEVTSPTFTLVHVFQITARFITLISIASKISMISNHWGSRML